MIPFSWTAASMPHMVLEPNQNCNLDCRGCYKKRGGGYRSVDELMRQLDAALAESRVQTVCLVGAEPTLHPDLVQIVEGVHQRGLMTSLATNGLRLTPELLGGLKRAGCNLVMLHVDEGQNRPDLPADATLDQVNVLRARLAQRVADAGIDVGLSAVIYPESLDRLAGLVELVLESEHINYLFAAHLVPQSTPGAPQSSGIAGCGPVPESAGARRSNNRDVVRLFRERLGIEPYGYLPFGRPVDGDGDLQSWVLYLVPVWGAPGRLERLPIRSGWMDRLLLKLIYLANRRHYFYVAPNRGLIASHLAMNALGRGRLDQVVRILAASAKSSNRFGAKQLCFDNGPMQAIDGAWTCAAVCPNRAPIGGRLVPVCNTYTEGTSP